MDKKFRKPFARFRKLRRKLNRRLKNASRHPYIMVPAVTFTALLAVTIGIIAIAGSSSGLQVSKDTKVVIVRHDGEQQVVPTHEPTVGDLLKKLNIKLDQGDVVEPGLSASINQDDYRINIYRAVPVEIVDGTQVSYTFSAATTPRAIVEQAGTTLYPEDNVSTTPDDDVLANGAIGEQVVIDRATPVNLNLYGTPLAIRTHATTVGQLIQQENIHLAATDQILPAASTPITPNMEVFVVRNGTKIESVTQALPMPIQTIQDSSLAFGESAVRQQGSAGQEVLTYQDNLQNGQVVSRSLIQTVVTQQPVTEVVAEGTSLSGVQGDMALAGIPAGDYQYVNYIVSHESGWCPTKAQGEHTCPAIPEVNVDTWSLGYGLCQATPGSKMSSAGSDWATDPVTQLEWCNGYALGRYGSWYAAYEHWLADSNW